MGTQRNVEAWLKGVLNPVETLKLIADNPRCLIWEARSELTNLNRMWFKHFRSADGIDVMNKDWDTLVLLDACRYDIFAEENWLDGTLKSCRSGGSDSSEFMTRNFAGRELHDTVYVSGNPYTAGLEEGTFHGVIPLLDEDWDKELGTVRPERVLQAAIDAHETYPNKRIIVHFMQPHSPFLINSEIHERLAFWRGMWALTSDVSRTELEETYRANLRQVLEYVQRFLDEIEGKIVISADHGEMLGERQKPIPVRGYQHKRHLYVDELLQVPWFVIESEENRRKIVSEPPERATSVSNEVARERLEGLGYVESL